MSEIDQIISQVPMDQIAARLGVDQGQAETAVRAALPALLGGLGANAQDPAGAASLTDALQDHDGSVLGSGLGAIDTDDGQKIVQNIFGGATDQVVSHLGGIGGTGGSGLIQKLLPILAPIVLAYLSKRVASSGGLGSILGSILGGGGGGGLTPSAGSTPAPAPTPGGPLIPTDGSDPAPGWQTPGSGATSGGGLGDILGGLLGGGKKKA